jgi:hypothetical protein
MPEVGKREEWNVSWSRIEKDATYQGKREREKMD